MAQQTFEELVAAVKQAESRGKRYAADGKTLTTSPKGALGEMQVMPKTILDPGFGVTPARDKSPDEIARVGVDYLQAMKQRYGDTEKALIAYNWGPGSTDKWIAAGAKPEALPAETRTYVQRVKGFLGKDVSRETMAKKDREPLPESLPPMAKAPESVKTTTVAKVSSREMPDIKSLPASYQAAFALAALADAKDDEDDKAFNEFKETEAEKLMRDYKPVNYLASLDLSVQPIMMNEGGEVEDRKRPDDINYFSNVNRMKDRGTTTDSVMLGASKKMGDGSVMAGLNMANMSRDEKLQTARALMLAYTQQDPEGLGINANIVKPEGAPAMANLMGSLPLGDGRVSAGMHGNQAYSLGYNRPVEGGQFDANLTVPRGTMGSQKMSPQLNLRYEKRFAEGGDVDIAGEDVSKPFFGNPNIRRQVGQARRIAAVRNANYGDELGEAKDTARKGEAYQELEKYLQSRGEMPSIKIGSYLPDGTHGVFFSDRANISTGDIKINKNLHDMYVPSTIAHEVTHAADRQMKQQAMEQGMFGKSNQFTEAYEKMVGPEGRNRTQLLRKRYPEFEEDNRYYRSRPDEVAAHGIGAYSGPAMQDRAPRHVDATAATEFRILMDLAQRNVDKGPTGLAKVPAFFRKLGRYAEGGPVYRANGGEAEPTAEELAAASTPAFIAQKSGIGRKEGNISKALKSGEGFKEAAKGLTMLPQNIVGAPVDLATMAMRPFGYNVEKPVMGSEYLKEKSRAAGLAFKPSDDPALAGFFEAGDLASNLVNPAGATRAGVKAAEKTGEAAKMLARDFQQYNQNLAVPGASYAVRNKGTPVAMTGLPFLPNVDEAEKVVKAVTIGQRAEPLAATDKSLNDWFSKTVTRYLRSDFASPQDQLVRAAEEGKMLHLAPKEFSDSAEDQLLKHFLERRQSDLEYMRQAEGFGNTNMATQPYAQRIEDITDISAYPEMVGDLTPNRVPPSMRKIVETQPEARVTDFAPNIVENLKLEALRDKMLDVRQSDGKYGAYGQPAVKIPSEFMLPDDTLSKLNVAAASNRMARYTRWQDETRQKMATTALRADPTFPRAQLQEGKFIGVALPDIKKNPEIKQLVIDVGCDGGWCTRYTPNAEAYASGFSRLHMIVTGEGKQARPVAQFAIADSGPAYDTKRFSITEVKEKGNTVDFENNPALPAIQEYVQYLDKTYGGLDYVDNLKGLRMTALPEYSNQVFNFFEPSSAQKMKLADRFGNIENGMRAVRDKAVDLNNGSRFIVGTEKDMGNMLEQATQLLAGPKENLARRIQMNLFGLPKEKATGGMIERQPTDNRRYL